MKRLVFAAATVAMLSACSHDMVGEQLVYQFGAKPPALQTFAYTDTEQADVQLYTSLKAMDDVRATFDNGQQLPAKLDKWRGKIVSSGGEVAVCDTVISAGGLPIALPVLAERVGSALYKLAVERELYSPAKRFNAVAEFDSSTNALTSMRFVSRETDMASVKAEYGECA